MEYEEKKQLALNYVNESAYWENKEEYIKSLNLNEKDSKSMNLNIKRQIYIAARNIKEI